MIAFFWLLSGGVLLLCVCVCLCSSIDKDRSVYVGFPTGENISVVNGVSNVNNQMSHFKFLP